MLRTGSFMFIIMLNASTSTFECCDRCKNPYQGSSTDGGFINSFVTHILLQQFIIPPTRSPAGTPWFNAAFCVCWLDNFKATLLDNQCVSCLLPQKGFVSGF